MISALAIVETSDSSTKRVSGEGEEEYRCLGPDELWPFIYREPGYGLTFSGSPQLLVRSQFHVRADYPLRWCSVESTTDSEEAHTYSKT